MSNLYSSRREYLRGSLLESQVAVTDPWNLWDLWWQEAVAEELEAAAFTLSTVDVRDLQPRARVLLLRGVHAGSLSFFTNYSSCKALDLAANPRACMSFFWEKLERQVIILGEVSRLSREENARYFASRPRESQLSAWASQQSQVVESRQALEQARASYVAEFAGKEIPCPPAWGGYSLEPRSMEFWQGGAYRLHDRLRYSKNSDSEWSLLRLMP